MIIMVLGMHRSGTSTISGVLHMNGVVMGTYQNFWPRPLNQNPKGFYENYDFRKINDHLLSKSGYHVESFLPNIPNIQQIDSLSRKMKLVIEKSAKVVGSVTSEDLVIKGRIIGPVFGKKVRFGSSARVEGDTFHETIAIEDGAYYEGSIKRHATETAIPTELFNNSLPKRK